MSWLGFFIFYLVTKVFIDFGHVSLPQEKSYNDRE
jgi:hypothetical protein